VAFEVGWLKRLGQRLLPKRLHDAGAAIYWLGTEYRCPICGWPTRAFRPLAVNPTFRERCSRCGSLARHRLLWLYLRERTDFFSARLKVLHFSPEGCFTERFRRLRNLDYTTADIAGGYTAWMETLDLTAIAKPDNTYDVVLCIHVLQAVEDDARAMREVFRVLKPGGWALLNSRYDPDAEKTRPNPALPPPEVRAAATQKDFAYRIYGRDFSEQLQAAGFEVEIVPFRDSLPPRLIARYFLKTSGDVVIARKPRA
jgi:SAM-dependent methyltransferase